MIPISLEMKNFFSHRDSCIDFTLFESALLIGNVEGNYDVSNGTGKSACFLGILWCLFNKSRTASMDDIILWGENACQVTFCFKQNDTLYRVVRKRNRSSSTTSVDFSCQTSSGSWIDISGSTPSLTNQEIEKIIHLDHKTFVNSVYFGQNDISEFAESDPARKKEILKSIIDLSKWDQYEIEGKEQLREVKNNLKILESKIENYTKYLTEYKIAEENLNQVESRLKEMNKIRLEAEELLQQSAQKYQAIKDTLDTQRWDQTVDTLNKLKEKIVKLTTQEQQAKQHLFDYQKKVQQKKQTYQELEDKITNLEIDPEIESKFSTLQNEIIETKTKLQTSNQLLKILKERNITQEQCYVCHQPIDEHLYHHLVENQQKEVGEHQRVQIYCQNKLNEFSTKSKSLEKLKENNKIKDIAIVKLETLETEIKILKEKVDSLESEQEILEKSIMTVKMDEQIHQKILESLKNDDFQELHQKISTLKKQIAEYSQAIEKHNHNIGILTEKKSHIKSQIDEIEIARQDFFDAQKKFIILEKLVKFLGKNGIQTILLNAIINDLEKTANEILISICNEPFVIFLDTQRTGADGVSIVDTLDLRVKKDGMIQNFKSLSGGEQFRISLALRIALSEISSRHGGSSLEFLLLDEINSPLDKHGTESLFVNVIKSLEKKYKILVITHNDSLKERFTNILDVTKINGESYINFISV